jgi:hypothetical protein
LQDENEQMRVEFEVQRRMAAIEVEISRLRAENEQLKRELEALRATDTRFDNRHHYRIQLLARITPLPDYSYYFSTEHNIENIIEDRVVIRGELFYIYTTGKYATHQEANRALKGFFERHGITQAWIVEYQEIKDSSNDSRSSFVLNIPMVFMFCFAFIGL